MFTTIEQTRMLTGKVVTQETIIMAQNIIESYTGHVEAEIEDPTDKDLLGKATAYQCAYMFGDEAKVFEQMNAMQILQFGQMVTFDPKSAAPFIAPLAVIACKRLSWNRIRSVQTGSLWPRGPRTGRGWSRE